MGANLLEPTDKLTMPDSKTLAIYTFKQIRQGTKVQIVLEKSNRSVKEAKKAAPAPKPAAPKGPTKSQEELLKEIQAEEKGRKRFFGLF